MLCQRHVVARILELTGVPLVESAHLITYAGTNRASLVFYWPPGHDPVDDLLEPPDFDIALANALAVHGCLLVDYLGGDPIQTTPDAVREELIVRILPPHERTTP